MSVPQINQLAGGSVPARPGPSALEILRQARATVETNPIHDRQMRYANVPVPASITTEIVTLCGKEKIVKQAPVFECPKWAGLPNSSEWHLEVKKADFNGKLPSLPLSRYPYFILGKNERVCDYRIEHPSTSQAHCALVFHEERGCFFIVDLDSTNGVFVDGVKIDRRKPVELHPATADEKSSEFVLGTSTRTYSLKNVQNRSGARRGGAVEPSAAAAQLALLASPSSPSNSLPGAVVAPSDSLASTSTVPVGEKRPREENTATTPVEEQQQSSAAINRRFRHILIKHADVAKPVSKARRNKEEPITRTKEDAATLAASVRDQYYLASASALNSTPEERYERRTQKFLEFCAAFSECGSEKKGGDLGMNQEGDFKEYMDSPEFDKAAFSLAPCAVSRPIETSLGIHLIFRCQPSEEEIASLDEE